jgi:surfeit locus 1 family protein
MSNKTFAFSVFGKHYFFTPKFTLLLIIITLMLLGFGIWQLQQARAIEDTVQLINKRFILEPIQASGITSSADWRFYPIELRGSFDNDHNILLYNRDYKGKRGYEVLTPFKPLDSSSDILVNRGWIPEAADPKKLPDIPSIPNVVQITGVLFKPINYFTLGSDFDESNVHWPLLSKRANLDKLSKALNSPLYPYLVLLSPGSDYGFVREWRWLSSPESAERHKVFANQWFILAFIVLMIFIFTNIHRSDS